MVKVNGEPREVDGITLSALFKQDNLNVMRIAAELNGSIVKRSEYSSTVLRDGDILEVVHFVGGG